MAFVCRSYGVAAGESVTRTRTEALERWHYQSPPYRRESRRFLPLLRMSTRRYTSRYSPSAEEAEDECLEIRRLPYHRVMCVQSAGATPRRLREAQARKRQPLRPQCARRVAVWRVVSVVARTDARARCRRARRVPSYAACELTPLCHAPRAKVFARSFCYGESRDVIK